jgi:hypothetical protein
MRHQSLRTLTECLRDRFRKDAARDSRPGRQLLKAVCGDTVKKKLGALLGFLHVKSCAAWYQASASTLRVSALATFFGPSEGVGETLFTQGIGPTEGVGAGGVAKSYSAFCGWSRVHANAVPLSSMR